MTAQRNALAPWLAFAGQGFLVMDKHVLLDLAAELRTSTPPSPELALLLDELECVAPDDLEREHVRLFCNPLGTPCPPWQSANTGEERLMGPSHRRALEWYGLFGFEPKADNEPADHIGLLLLFAGALAENDNADELLPVFASDHLAWMGPFLEKVSAETRLPFYRLLADTTIGLLRFV